jgi:hypothetical protein
MTKTIEELAKELSDRLITKTRANTEQTPFVCLKDDSPEWMQDVCRKAHGDMLPDDWRYEFIEEAALALQNYDDFESAMSAIEPSMYNNALLAWLASNSSRVDYADNAIDSGARNIMDAIQWAQCEEKREVYQSVFDSLTELAENEGD